MQRRFRNSSIIPSGMLAPSGYQQTPVNPVVQSTTRPPGSLLPSSPGYDSVREGKTVFQGQGPTGGFKPLEFAEDVGASGAAISITPGDTTQIESSSWLPDESGEIEEGSMIVSDRNPVKRIAHRLHEGNFTIPDMGDRHPGRPNTMAWLKNPISMFDKDYRERPIFTVIAASALVGLTYIIGNDLEREYKSRRGRGVASAVGAAPEAGAATSGDEVDRATRKVTDTVNDAVKVITDAADGAANTIKTATGGTA